MKSKPYYADQGIPNIIQNVYGAKKIIPKGMPIPVDADEAARIMKTTLTGYPHPRNWPVDSQVEDSATDQFDVDDFINLMTSPSSSTDSRCTKRSLNDDTAFESPPTSLAEKAKQEFKKRSKLMAAAAAPTKLFHDSDEEEEDSLADGPAMFNEDKGDEHFLEEVTETPPRPTSAQRDIDIKVEPGTSAQRDIDIKVEPGTSTVTVVRPAFTSPTPSILIKKKARNAPKKLTAYETSI